MNKKQFGTRKGREHGNVFLGRRSAIRCRVIDRNNWTIYLELAESVLLPYAFEVSIEAVGNFMCEVKSQRSNMVVGNIVSESQLVLQFASELAEQGASTTIKSHRAVNFRPTSGFKS